MFGLSKREKLEAEIKRIQVIISRLSYQFNSISELQSNFKSDAELEALSQQLGAAVESTIKINWNLFTKENLESSGYNTNPEFCVNELHNNAVYNRENGYIKILGNIKIAITQNIKSLINNTSILRTFNRETDPVYYNDVLQNYSNILSALKTALSSLTADLMYALS